MDTKRFWNDRLSAHWGTEGVGYLALGRGFNYWMYVLRRVLFRRLVPPGHARACDIGAGTGVYTNELIKKGYQVTGVDISSRAVEGLSRAFPQARFVEGDVTEGLGGQYELIVAMDVLFHIMDDTKYRAAIEHIAAALSSGGRLIFSDNFPPERVAHKHQVSRSATEITAVLSAAGLRIVERWPMFVLMNAPVKYRTGWWYVLERILWRAPALGWAIGALLLPLEYVLVTSLRQTPSTEIVICERI